MNIADEWRGFNRTGKQGADCCEIGRHQRPSEPGFALADDPTRAPLPHLKCGRAVESRRDFPLPAGVPIAALWHFNCLGRIGRWWPGTLVVTNRLRFPTFRIINS